VRFRLASSRRMMMGMSMRGPLKKILMAPHCVRTIRPTRRSTPDVQPETGKRSTGFGKAAEPRLDQASRPAIPRTEVAGSARSSSSMIARNAPR
jgi:hypothetical protein